MVANEIQTPDLSTRHTIGFGLLRRSKDRGHRQGLVDVRRIERHPGRASDFPLDDYVAASPIGDMRGESDRDDIISDFLGATDSNTLHTNK